MDIPYFVVHAFSSRAFEGSPAVVCLLEEALPDTVLMAIAAEGAGVETTFLRRTDHGYEIRWLTASRELPLCTHATLAAGAVVLRHVFPSETRVTFLAESGPLEVTKRGEQFAMALPRLVPTRVDDIPEALARGLRVPPAEVFRAGKYVAVYTDEIDVRALAPDFARLAELETAGVIVTARGSHADFVLRSFALDGRVGEEQVSGSAFSRLVPMWAQRLGRSELSCRQLSSRGADIQCVDRDGRVEIGGPAVTFAHGRITL